jgi:hypothetical protein
MPDINLHSLLPAIKRVISWPIRCLWPGASRGPRYRGTVASLITCYRTDPDSPFHAAEYKTRIYYLALMRRLERDCGTVRVRSITAREVKRWHEQWNEGGHVTMSHAVVGMLRTLIGFGAGLLEDEACARLGLILHKMRFPLPKPRTEQLTAAQVVEIRAQAHKEKLHSIALAQAIQFGGTLRQKDVIGEYLPLSEPGASDVVVGRHKWVKGLRWEEIDADFVLDHLTSKKKKPAAIELLIEPMVVEELRRLARLSPNAKLTRDKFPERGPVIVCERSGVPWRADKFRRRWRELARACNISDKVKEMDSRAGAISEALDAEVPIEHVSSAATHSDTKMTRRYNRSQQTQTANAMSKRVEYRMQQLAARRVSVRRKRKESEVANAPA